MTYFKRRLTRPSKMRLKYSNNSSNKKSQKKNCSSSYTSKKREKNSKEKEVIQIAKNITINNELCHHCKQKKPAEIMVRCQSNHANKTVEKPSKNFIINHNTVLKSTYLY